MENGREGWKEDIPKVGEAEVGKRMAGEMGSERRSRGW